MKIPAAALREAVTAFEERPDAEVKERIRAALRAAGVAFPDTEFMGAAEAAEQLGVKSPNLRRVKDLPPPFGNVRSGPFWRAEDIRKLARERARNGSARKVDAKT